MAISLDREGNESRALFELAGSFTDKRVLEIGCGDGRLTWRYAPRAAQVVAIDPNQEKVDQARQNLPAELSRQVSFHALGLEDYVAQHPSHNRANQFDLALLSWSL